MPSPLAGGRRTVPQGWRELEDLREEGLVGDLGVSNFSVAQLESLMAEARVAPAVNQLELHPLDTRGAALADFGRERGLATIAYAPLARGKLKKSQNLERIAQRHGKTVSHVILRWHLQRGRCVIPKSGREERIRENFDVWDFELPDEDLRIVDRQNQGRSALKAKFEVDAEGWVIERGRGWAYEELG